MRRARKGLQSSGAAPEESNATKRALSGRLCWMRRARKGLQSSGAAPEESNATKRALSGRLCWMRRARKGPRALLGWAGWLLTCYKELRCLICLGNQVRCNYHDDNES